MDVIAAIESCCAVKYFDPSHVMNEVVQQRLMRLALLSPIAFNIQHWRFVVVKVPALRQEIRAIS